MTDDWAAGILALAALVTALAVLWRHLIRPTIALSRRVSEFLDDWNGEPARPGRPRVKGIPERMTTLEADQATIINDLEGLRAEVRTYQTESSTDRTDLRARLAELVRGPGPPPPDQD